MAEIDRRRIAADRNELNALRLRATTPFGAPTFSLDGRGALLIANI